MVLTVCLSAAVIAGCGSGGTPTTTAPANNGLAAMRAPDILAAAVSALRSVSGYRVQGTSTTGSSATRERLVASFYAPHQVSMSVDEGSSRFQAVIDAGTSYLRGSRKFWDRSIHDNGAAKELANRWFRYDVPNANRLTADLEDLNPSRLSACLTQFDGKVVRAGTTIVAGQKAIVVREIGNVPGGQPLKIAIAATGAAYPLEVDSYGKTRPGGPKGGPCGSSGSGSNGDGDDFLSDFGDPGTLTVPAHAKSLTAAIVAARRTSGI